MTAVSGEAAADRKAATRAERLEPFDRPEFAVSDAAKGIAKAVAGIAAGRHDDREAPILEHGPDVFHTAIGGRPRARPALATCRSVLGRSGGRRRRGRRIGTGRDGIDARGVAQTARAGWARAVAHFAHFAHAERLESAWGRGRAAPDLFGPDGRLHDRARAEAEVDTARKDLTGQACAKVRNSLKDRRGPALLDRMPRRLESAEPRREWREAMARRCWLRSRRPTAPDPLTGPVRAAGRDRVPDEEERASYERVTAVLNDAVRAGGAVGCMNSVQRMQPPRHERMTRPMHDLKRLDWNCHSFRSGPREGASPYRALGLDLPTFDSWSLLRTDPGELMQRLSTSPSEG